MKARVYKRGKIKCGKLPYQMSYMLRVNQTWECIQGENAYIVRRDNISIGLPVNTFKNHFKEVRDENK